MLGRAHRCPPRSSAHTGSTNHMHGVDHTTSRVQYNQLCLRPTPVVFAPTQSVSKSLTIVCCCSLAACLTRRLNVCAGPSTRTHKTREKQVHAGTRLCSGKGRHSTAHLCRAQHSTAHLAAPVLDQANHQVLLCWDVPAAGKQQGMGSLQTVIGAAVIDTETHS